MENIGKDLISYIGLKLDLESVEKLCQTSSKFKQVCDSNYFWRQKLEREFSIDISRVIDMKGLYKYLLSKPKVQEIDYPTSLRDFNKLVDSELKIGDLVKGMEISKVVGANYVFRPENIFRDEIVSFPEFPPHYYQDENLRVYIPYQEVEDFDKSYIEGKFGERYNKKNIITDDGEDPYGVFENYELIVYI